MLLKGSVVAEHLLSELKLEISHYPSPPGLAVILIGNNPASEIYVKTKIEKANAIGIISKAYRLPYDVDLNTVLRLIDQLNQDSSIHSILVQLPLPKHLDSQIIIQRIHPDKDVDGLHPINVGKLLLGQTNGRVPCTPAGIIELLSFYHISTQGQHVVILGRSDIVGKPLAALLMQKNAQANATVTLLHSQSKNIEPIIQTADIVVAAIGSPLFIKEHMVSSHSVLIDVGVNRISSDGSNKGSLVGDIDFHNVVSKCKAISPVPGGVGPMTVAMLMKNTCESYKSSLF